MALPNELDLYFDGILTTCELHPDRNDEILYVAKDGSRFAKFTTDENFEDAVSRHNAVNNVEVEYAMPDDVFDIIDNTKVYA